MSLTKSKGLGHDHGILAVIPFIFYDYELYTSRWWSNSLFRIGKIKAI